MASLSYLKPEMELFLTYLVNQAPDERSADEHSFGTKS